MKRYEATINTLTKDEIIKLKNITVAVIGCGGLGGYIIEELSRLGVGNIKLVDNDKFTLNNLNRQLIATEKNIGHSKVLEAEMRVRDVNSDVNVTTYQERFTFKNADRILEDVDVVFDATDNIVSRLFLEEECEIKNIPIIHGAISGWYGQVAVVLPGSNVLSKLYKDRESMGKYTRLGNPPFTPGVVASMQINEFVKYVFKKGNVLSDNVLFIDLLNHEYVKTTL